MIDLFDAIISFFLLVTLATTCSLRRALSNESMDFIENKVAISESKNKMIVTIKKWYEQNRLFDYVVFCNDKNGFSESGFLLMEEP